MPADEAQRLDLIRRIGPTLSLAEWGDPETCRDLFFLVDSIASGDPFDISDEGISRGFLRWWREFPECSSSTTELYQRLVPYVESGSDADRLHLGVAVWRDAGTTPYQLVVPAGQHPQSYVEEYILENISTMGQSDNLTKAVYVGRYRESADG